MVGLFRTLLIIFVIMMALRLFRMYVAPYLMRKGVEKMNQKMRDHMESQFQQQRPVREEGEVTVERTQRKTENRNLDEGEYVEFEEIE